MKTRLLLLALLVGTAASAQTVGIRLAAGKTAYAFGGEAFRRAIRGSEHSFSAGVYYERPIWKRLGVSTGLNYLQQRNMPYTGIYIGLELQSENRDLIELPVYLHLRLAPARQKVWNLQLLGGYSYGHILAVTQYVSDGAQRIRNARAGWPDYPSYHFFNMGLECSYLFRNRQVVSLGLQQRLGWRPFGGGSYYERSRDYCIVVKTGLRYRSEKHNSR